MRLQLIVGAAVALVLVAAPAHAQTGFTSKLQVYVDDDHTQVYSPLVRASADVTPATNVSAGYVADVVTSASIDVVSQASPTTIHDLRHQVAASVTHTTSHLVWSAGYTFSSENDYLSNGLHGGVQWLSGSKNTTLSVGGGVTLNDVGRSGDRNFHEDLDVVGGTLALTQILSPTLIGQLTYELQLADGYQASPYRFVPVGGGPGDVPQFWVPETDPDARWRHAVVAGVNRWVGEDSALQADYRFYRDTWGITSHTVEARLVLGLGRRAELRLRARTYLQSGASFYQARYMEVRRYMVVDRELSPLWSETLGGKLSVRVGERLELELKADGFYYHYDDFPLLASRVGANVGLGLELAY